MYLNCVFLAGVKDQVNKYIDVNEMRSVQFLNLYQLYVQSRFLQPVFLLLIIPA